MIHKVVCFTNIVKMIIDDQPYPQIVREIVDPLADRAGGLTGQGGFPG